jgi:hypothetical protein
MIRSWGWMRDQTTNPKRVIFCHPERDDRIAELCDDNWVTLIVIPYWVPNIREFIMEGLRLLGYI